MIHPLNGELELCDEMTEDGDVAKLQTTKVGEETTTGPAVELSLNSIVGLSNPGTIKLRGTIEGTKVVILIDCGATHNFIAQKVVEEQNLPMLGTANYVVIMGTGTAVKSKGVCKAVVLKIGELTIVESFLPI